MQYPTTAKEFTRLRGEIAPCVCGKHPTTYKNSQQMYVVREQLACRACGLESALSADWRLVVVTWNRRVATAHLDS